ncbi:hypothetical protein [Brevundimonas vesicularis]|uniref:hypothetical protein n=1 Tax=Brevundimonas vesicularis TaxID=41276 RepID=UPI0038D401DD
MSFAARKYLPPVASAFLALSVAVGCGEARDPAPLAPEPPRDLAGVNLDEPLRVLGTEPFWHLDIGPTTLNYLNADETQHVADNPGPALQGASAVWATQTKAGMPLKITLTPIDCSDGMSDRIYPLSAEIELGSTQLTGCAAALTALERAGESGRVE